MTFTASDSVPRIELSGIGRSNSFMTDHFEMFGSLVTETEVESKYFVNVFELEHTQNHYLTTKNLCLSNIIF